MNLEEGIEVIDLRGIPDDEGPEMAAAILRAVDQAVWEKALVASDCRAVGSERHQVIHTLNCRVVGCQNDNPVFTTVHQLGQHLVAEHNAGAMNACTRPGYTKYGGYKARDTHSPMSPCLHRPPMGSSCDETVDSYAHSHLELLLRGGRP